MGKIDGPTNQRQCVPDRPGPKQQNEKEAVRDVQQVLDTAMIQRGSRIFTKKGEGNALDDAGQRQFYVDDQAVELQTVTDQGFESGGIRRSRQDELMIADLGFLCQDRLIGLALCSSRIANSKSQMHSADARFVICYLRSAICYWGMSMKRVPIARWHAPCTRSEAYRAVQASH